MSVLHVYTEMKCSQCGGLLSFDIHVQGTYVSEILYIRGCVEIKCQACKTHTKGTLNSRSTQIYEELMGLTQRLLKTLEKAAPLHHGNLYGARHRG